MLKTVIKHTERQPIKSAIDELKTLMPELDIIFEKYDGEIKTHFNPYFQKMEMSWEWLKSLFDASVDIKCFMTSRERLKEVGIKAYLGLYNLDLDSKHEFFICNERDLDSKARLNKFKHNFARMFVHEYLHGIHFMRYKDAKRASEEVHQWEKEGTLKQHLIEMQEYRNKLEQTVSLATILRDLLTKLVKKN